jgi:hypothetical protein
VSTGKNFWQRLSRPDWLGELQVGLIIAVALASGVLLVEISSLVAGEPVLVELSASDITDVTGASGGLAPGVTVPADSPVQVAIAHPGTGEQLWYAVGQLSGGVLLLAMLALLLRLVVTARRTDPFTAVTVRRLRVLALVSAVGGIVVGLLGMVAGLALSNAATAGRVVETPLDLHIEWLLLAVGFLAIGEIIQRGRALRTELDTVV